ncbi:A1S_2505 family phage non-structural protein [Xanthomonas euvesicatoria]
MQSKRPNSQQQDPTASIDPGQVNQTMGELQSKHPEPREGSMTFHRGFLYQFRAASNGWQRVAEPETHASCPVFVFGSNLRGIHGAGAALHAKRHHGAKNGIGEGPTGNAYALPTKLTPRISLPLEEVAEHVGLFLTYARARPETTFRVTAVGCGLAGFTVSDIAPLFAEAPDNCVLPSEFLNFRTKPIQALSQ